MAPHLPVLDLGLTPKTIGAYEVLEHIGRGRTADVFLAQTLSPEGTKRVVLKRLREDLVDDPTFCTAFAKQADLTLRLHHPHVVETLEARIGGDEGVTSVEFLDGQLLSRIRERPDAVTAVPLSIHLRVLSDVLAALHYLHEASEPEAPDGIVHGDVRPEKIFVTQAGGVKLLHSGIAGAGDDTGTSILKERLSYLSPEHARGEAIDRRSDIFSVGIMLWEAITGLRFWQDWHELAIYRRLCSTENVPLRPPWIPIASRELFDVADRAIAVTPDQRYETAREMQEAIDSVLTRPGNRASTGDLRAFMAVAFGDIRSQLESVTDEAPTRVRMPELPPPPGPVFSRTRTLVLGTLAHVQPSHAMYSPPSEPPTSPRPPSLPAPSLQPPNEPHATQPPPLNQPQPVQDTLSPTSTPMPTPASTLRPPARPDRKELPQRMAYIVLGAALVVLGAVMLSKVLTQEAAAPQRSSAAVVEPATAVPPALGEQEPVAPALRVPPASMPAKILSEGGAVPALPASSSRPPKPGPRRTLAREDPWGI